MFWASFSKSPVSQNTIMPGKPWRSGQPCGASAHTKITCSEVRKVEWPKGCCKSLDPASKIEPSDTISQCEQVKKPDKFKLRVKLGSKSTARIFSR